MSNAMLKNTPAQSTFLKDMKKKNAKIDETGAKEKNASAVELGSLGGKARARKLKPEARTEIAKKAARVRWARNRQRLSKEPDGNNRKQ
jgi:hypothetical protein